MLSVFTRTKGDRMRTLTRTTLLLAALVTAATTAEAGTWRYILRSQGLHVGQGYNFYRAQSYGHHAWGGHSSWDQDWAPSDDGLEMSHDGYSSDPAGSPMYERLGPGTITPSPRMPIPRATRPPNGTPLWHNSVVVPRSATAPGGPWQAGTRQAGPRQAAPWQAGPRPAPSYRNSQYQHPQYRYPVERYPSVR